MTQNFVHEALIFMGNSFVRVRGVEGFAGNPGHSGCEVEKKVRN